MTGLLLAGLVLVTAVGFVAGGAPRAAVGSCAAAVVVAGLVGLRHDDERPGDTPTRDLALGREAFPG